VIPWLKKRDIAILGWETPDYAPHPPGDLPPSSLHNFVLTILGVHLLDRAAPDSSRNGIARQPDCDVLIMVSKLTNPLRFAW